MSSKTTPISVSGGTTQTTKLVLAAVFIVLLVGSFALGWYMAPRPTGRSVLTGEIPIGAILALTGDLGTYGMRERAAVELAVDDVNAYLQAVGASFTIKLLVEDTETKPDVALTKLQSLAARGVKAVVGPLSSAEIRNIKGYADSNHIVIVSQSSTATDLSIPGDFVFRLVTDDNPQGRVLAKLMFEKGIRHIFLFYRGDTYGDGLAAVINQTFTSLGGEVLDHIRYNPDATSFSAELAALNTRVAQAVQQYGADKVAIEIVSFEEAAQVLLQAKDYPTLLSVKWFACDGTAMSSRISSQAGSQAAAVGLYSTIFTMGHGDKWASLRERIIAKIGEEPDEYAYVAYDCLWAIALSILATNAYDGQAIKNALPSVANSYFGASGWTQLNAAGDRAGGDYAVYVVVPSGTGFDWARAATYNFASDSITWHIQG
jgi:branched-chain amino acid transport system substrate-binding protein